MDGLAESCLILLRPVNAWMLTTFWRPPRWQTGCCLSIWQEPISEEHWRQTIEEGLHQRLLRQFFASVPSYLLSCSSSIRAFTGPCCIIWAEPCWSGICCCTIRLPQARGWMGNTFYILCNLRFLDHSVWQQDVHKMTGDSMYIGSSYSLWPTCRETSYSAIIQAAFMARDIRQEYGRFFRSR